MGHTQHYQACQNFELSFFPFWTYIITYFMKYNVGWDVFKSFSGTYDTVVGCS